MPPIAPPPPPPPIDGCGDSLERLDFSCSGTRPATVTTITRSPCAAGASSASRSSVGPFERVYSSTAVQRGPFDFAVAPSTYPAAHTEDPSHEERRGASESHASALIWPSL